MENYHDAVVIQRSAKPVKMIFTGQITSMSDKVRKKIDAHWNGLIASGKKYLRGDVFTIKDIQETPSGLVILATLTDYAHYIATVTSDAICPQFPCRVVHTAVLIESSDAMLIFGEMAPHTSSPGRLQCAGGGITRDDLLPDNSLDIFNNAKTELAEETGLDLSDPKIGSMEFSYLKTGGKHDSISAIFVARINSDADDIIKIFTQHNKSLEEQNIVPEFSRLICIPKNSAAVAGFLTHALPEMDEYLPSLLRIHSSVD